jgi:two-component system, OmpR family, sensor histidine kinase TctE
MTARSWPRASLRRFLMVLLLPGLGAVFTGELWLGWRTASDAADAAYDRSLLGAVKSLDSNISTVSGGLGVELPYRMLEFFELTAQGQVFYRVATEDGLVEIGSANLPTPPSPLLTGEPQFHEGTYMGQEVRVGSYARNLNPPLAGHSVHQRVVIQVAETLEARDDFRHALVLQALARDILLMMTASGLLVLAIAWAMRPLDRLRREVDARDPKDLTPVNDTDTPAEVRPLVQAINHHIERNREQAEARRRFIDDASHQLRTPLTTLATQVAYAQRETNPALQHQALKTIQEQLDETIRQTNQMLSLARVDSAPTQQQTFDFVVLAESLIRHWWGVAREQDVDLGLNAPDHSLWFQGEPDLLREALSNLLHNAIRYCGSGGQVTLTVSARPEGAVHISVLDNGPGLPSDELVRAGERFFRGAGNALPGSGLGLAIVSTVAQRHGGHMHVSTGPKGEGLIVTLVLPNPKAPMG